VLKEVGEVSTITSKNTQKDFKKRELTLADDTQTSVRLTIWGNSADSFDVPLESILAFKGVKVSDFGGRSLSLLSSGSMTVEPDIDEAHKLRGWYHAAGQNATFSTHQNMATNSGGKRQDSKLISTIKEEESYLQDTPAYYSLKASVIYVSQKSTPAYPACQTPNCNKKVIEENPGEWWCEKCQAKWDKPLYRYVLNVNVADHSGSIYLSCFDEAGRTILGMPADDLVALQENDEAAYAQALLEACCKTYNFRVRAKMETYQDQPR
jgi:replication factor A1